MSVINDTDRLIQGKGRLDESERMGKGQFPKGAIEELEESGINIILETKERSQDKGFILEGLYELELDFEYTLSRLFEGSEGEPPTEDPYMETSDLANFWCLNIPERTHFDSEEDIFNLSYNLIDKLNLRSSEPDIPIFVGASPEEHFQHQMSNKDDPSWHLKNMRVEAAWNYSDEQGKSARGEGVIVGHPDTGIADHVVFDEPRILKHLANNFVEPGTDPKDPLKKYGQPGHGTSTASVILGDGCVETKGGTKAHYSGVAPEASLIPIRTSDRVWWIFSSHLAKAIYYASLKKCHVVSISMGGTSLKALKKALEHAVSPQNNCLVIAAAGNKVKRISLGVVWPARYKECIALAATDINGKPWTGSCRGKEVTVSAPGEDVWRALREHDDFFRNLIESGNGTSYATANAAGVAALWLGHFGRNNLVQKANGGGEPLQALFMDELKKTAQLPGHWSERDKKHLGAGIVDAEALLKRPILSSSTAGPVSTVVSLHQPYDSENLEAIKDLIGNPLFLNVSDKDIILQIADMETGKRYEILRILTKLLVEKEYNVSYIPLKNAFMENASKPLLKSINTIKNGS